MKSPHNPMTYPLLGIGNPLLDMSATVPQSFLDKYKLENNGAILADENHVGVFYDIHDYQVSYIAGGAAQNGILTLISAMRGAQWLLPANHTAYIGSAGNDERGLKLKEAAAKDGLSTFYQTSSDKPTGCCAVLINGIHRSLVTDLLAANDYSISHLKSDPIWKLVIDATYFYVGGYFLTVSPDSALEIAKHAAQENKHFTMNLSAPFIPQFFTKAVMDLAPYWDVLFGNESEALAYAKANFYETTDIAEIALLVSNLPKINDKRPRVVVFTHGDKPTVIATQGKTSFYPVIPIAEKDIVDTNGAGDAFCGGFMSQYVLGKSLKDCCNAGHYVANVVIQRHGPSYPEEKGVFVASDY